MDITQLRVTREDLQDPHLTNFNQMLQSIAEALINLTGVNGEINLSADINLNGNRIRNIGAPEAESDAVSLSAATEKLGPAVVRKALEVGGSYPLQTVRRLNDTTQREQNSTFLNAIYNTAPSSNTSTVIVTSLGGGQSQIDLSAGFQELADDSKRYYPSKSIVVTNPGVGEHYYYFYQTYKTGRVGVDGPYTADTSYNRLWANQDGRSLIAAAKVVAAGGGTGGGGGGGTGGCTEVGTVIRPRGDSKDAFTVKLSKCGDWVDIEFKSGHKISCARGTKVPIMVNVEDLWHGALWAHIDSGKLHPVKQVSFSQRNSEKQDVDSPPSRIYDAEAKKDDGSTIEVSLHNLKVDPGGL